MNRLTANKVCCFVSLAIFIVDLFFNAASMFQGPLLELFFNNTKISDAANFVDSAIPVSRWIFFIWSIIYIYQLTWIILAIIFAFKKKACIVPIGTFIGFIFACIFNFIWLITYSFNQIVTSFIVLFLLFVSITFASYWSTIYIARCGEEHICRRTKRALHILLVNGLFLYWSWILVAVHFNLDNVFVFSGIAENTSGAIILGLFILFQIGNIIIDICVLKHRQVNTLVVYPVFIAAFISMITANANFFASAGEITGLVMFNLILAIVFFALKLYLAIRHRRCSHGVSHIVSKA